VKCRLACANQGHGSCTIRVHCIGTRAGTPDQRNVAVYRDCGHLGQLAVAIERRFGNAINEERPPPISLHRLRWVYFEAKARLFLSLLPE
jgi:hypothetical protein